MARPLELTILESREELEHRLDRQQQRAKNAYRCCIGSNWALLIADKIWLSCCTRAKQRLPGG